MIQISQEELFRKIETEHDCNTGALRGDEQHGSRRGSSCESVGASRNASVCSPLCKDMSSMTLVKTQEAETNTNKQTSIPTVPSTETTTTIITTKTTTTTAATNIRKDSLSSTKDKNNNIHNNDNDDDDDASNLTPATANQHHQAAPTIASGNEEKEVRAVLITGCGSKIGTNIAVAFAAQGLKVALVDFDMKQTEAVARECQEKSPKNRVPLQIVADMSQLAEAHKVIDRTIDAFGRLDVLVNTVNNVGLMEAKFNASGDDDPHVFEQYHKIIANNMHAVTYLCISAAPYLRKTKGTIVNVSSITNNETGSYKFAYCMSKAGISTLTKCLATDLAPDIKVICVSPKSDASP